MSPIYLFFKEDLLTEIKIKFEVCNLFFFMREVFL